MKISEITDETLSQLSAKSRKHLAFSIFAQVGAYPKQVTICKAFNISNYYASMVVSDLKKLGVKKDLQLDKQINEVL